MRRFFQVGGVLVVLVLLARVTKAERTPASLSWNRLPGAEACIDAPALATKVEQRLGVGALVVPSQATISIEGRVAPATTGRGWQANIAIAETGKKPEHERKLESKAASCRALDEALVLVISLLIDPDAPQAAEVETVNSQDRVVIKTIYLKPRWRVAARSGVVAELGSQPGLMNPAVHLALRSRPPGLPWIELGVWLSQPSRAESRFSGREAELHWLGAALMACPTLFQLSRTTLLGCGGIDLGYLRAVGKGFETSTVEHTWIPRLGVGVDILQSLTRHWNAGLRLGGRVPLSRATIAFERSELVADSSQPLYRTAALQAQLMLYLEFTDLWQAH